MLEGFLEKWAEGSPLSLFRASSRRRRRLFPRKKERRRGKQVLSGKVGVGEPFRRREHSGTADDRGGESGEFDLPTRESTSEKG